MLSLNFKDACQVALLKIYILKKGALTELQSRQLEKISHFKAYDTKLKNHEEVKMQPQFYAKQ